jgi:hypothetical protein
VFVFVGFLAYCHIVNHGIMEPWTMDHGPWNHEIMKSFRIELDMELESRQILFNPMTRQGLGLAI